MPSTKFETAIPAIEPLQTCSLDPPGWAPNVIRVIKSRIMRRVEHMVRMGERINTRFWWGDLNIEDGDD